MDDLRKDINTKKISHFHEMHDLMVIETFWDEAMPRFLKISRGRGKKFIEQLEDLRQKCADKGCFFTFFIGIRSAFVEPYEIIQIDHAEENFKKMWVNLYLNENNDICEYSVRAMQTTERSGRQNAVCKLPIEEFQRGLDYMLGELEHVRL